MPVHYRDCFVVCMQKKRWGDNIEEWRGMDFASSTTAAEDRTGLKAIVVKSSVVSQRPCKLI